MRHQFSCAAAAFVLAAIIHVPHAVSAAVESRPAERPLSLSEFDYLIGHWSCKISEPGKPASQSTVSFEWLYGGKVLKETVSSGNYDGQFFTTLDEKNNKFKGVAVANDGGYIVWENPGMVDDHASEVGYLFAAGKLIPASRSESEKVDDKHYIIRDFGPDSADGKRGRESDTEYCTKG